MSDEDRLEWEQRYRDPGRRRRRTQPSPLLVQYLDKFPRGRALDVACGLGRNALFLAQHGYQVDAVDISEEALRQAEALARARGLRVHWVNAELDSDKLPSGPYQVVVNCLYLNRSLIPELKDAVEEGGYILVEQHLRSLLPVGGPQDPSRRVESNELPRLFGGFRILHYEETVITEAEGDGTWTTAMVRMLARKDGGAA